uniref:Uncharacterized protein n=1 Tax=Megaselia scalaris TaxID=36166 RepID=T1GWP2_MEGSC
MDPTKRKPTRPRKLSLPGPSGIDMKINEDTKETARVYVSGSSVLKLSLPGPSRRYSSNCESGDRGYTGPDGLKGPRGPTGPTGDRGWSGSNGVDGEKGDRGENGVPGKKGDRGDSISLNFKIEFLRAFHNDEVFRNQVTKIVTEDIKGNQAFKGEKGEPDTC